MATTQTSRSTNDKNKNADKSKAAPRGKTPDVASDTGERDESYNLVSVLYHALQGAQTISQYQKDAQREGDEELVQFFEATRSGYAEIAQEAKQLLAARMSDAEGEEDEDDEEEEDDEA